MKNGIAIFTAIALQAGLLTAQVKQEGVIAYDLTVNLHANLTKEQAIYKSMIPETSTQPVKLFFRQGSYRVEELEPENSKQGGTVVMMMSSSGATRLVRNDRQLAYEIYKKGAKTYYTEEKITAVALAVDRKSTKKILGYTCYKAVYKDTHNEPVELWITDDLKLSANPMEPITLSGTVLEINSRKLAYKARKIDFGPQADKLFEIQAGDKKITKEQAEDLQYESISDFQKKAGAAK